MMSVYIYKPREFVSLVIITVTL